MPGTSEASASGFGYVRRGGVDGSEGPGVGGDGTTEVLPGRRLRFGAGETKQHAFDLDLRGRGAGPFAVRGFYNVDTTLAVVARARLCCDRRSCGTMPGGHSRPNSRCKGDVTPPQPLGP
jgi:hypothetical protein